MAAEVDALKTAVTKLEASVAAAVAALGAGASPAVLQAVGESAAKVSAAADALDAAVTPPAP